MHNGNWLKPEWFECLARHQVTHAFNSWEAMPPVADELQLGGVGEVVLRPPVLEAVEEAGSEEAGSHLHL
jgi:hypothetical protein